MDSSKFDDLARSIAQHSRRSFLRSALGVALGGALGTVGVGGTLAANKRGPGKTCSRDADCATGICGEKNRTKRRTCVCPEGTTACGDECVDAPVAFQSDEANCGACGKTCKRGQTCENGTCASTGSCTSPAQCPRPSGACQIATCVAGQCGIGPAANGTSCDDGDKCTQTDTCQNGVCTGGNPVVCAASDQCHTAGVCDPTTGTCSNPNAPDGTTCDDGNRCTTGDVCTSGICGGTAVTCPKPTACQVNVACDPSSGTCVAVNQPDGTLCGADNACSHDVCQAGVCVSGVAKPSGTACNDANACTQTDACDGAGQCVSGAPVICPAPDACHTGSCDQSSGQCTSTQLNDTCFVAGTCYAAGDPDPTNPCKVCDPIRSATSFSNRSNGFTCDDGDKCTRTDTCQDGVCTGGNPVVCTASDQCHTAGVCDPTTGTCSNPDKANGSACNRDPNACTLDTCENGVCMRGRDVVCPAAPDACHDPGFCNPATGLCSEPTLIVDFQGDAYNCGSCGHTCDLYELCFDGVCANTCETISWWNACEHNHQGCRLDRPWECSCTTKIDGSPVCADVTGGVTCDSCTSDADCPDGWVCTACKEQCGPGGTTCFPVC